MDGTEAGELLGTIGRVSREARRARHGYWFPLLLLGGIILAALPLYHFSTGPDSGSSATPRVVVVTSGNSALYRFDLSDGPGNHPWGTALFWLVAMPLAFIAVAAFYVVRARRTGLRGRIWPYVTAGLVLFALLLVSAPGILGLFHAPEWLRSWHRFLGDLYIRGLTPILVIALGFFVLSRLERSWALFWISVAFLPIALLANLYNISNVFQRLNWIVPDWAANITVAGGFLVFAGLVSLISLRVGGGHHEPSR